MHTQRLGVSPDRFEFHFIQSLIDSALALLTPPSHPFTNMACASALCKVTCGLEGIMKNVIVVIRCKRKRKRKRGKRMIIRRNRKKKKKKK